MQKRNDEETALHIASVNLLRLTLPPGAVIHHSHNEGKRSKRDAALAKAMGQRAGFADLMILHDSRAYFIEFKSSIGRQSKSQMDFEDDLAATGFPHYAIVRTIDELIGTLRAWGFKSAKIGNAGHAPIRGA